MANSLAAAMQADVFDREKCSRLLSTRLQIVNLKALLREESLPVSGAKAVLVDRIVSHLSGLRQRQDAHAYNSLRARMLNMASPSSRASADATLMANGTPTSTSNYIVPSASRSQPVGPQLGPRMGGSTFSTPIRNASSPHTSSRPAGAHQAQSSSGRPSSASGSVGRVNGGGMVGSQAIMRFKNDPFYTFVEAQCSLIDVPNGQRQTTRNQFQLTSRAVDLLRSDARHRLYLVSGNTFAWAGQALLMDFPNAFSLTVNGNDVRITSRGIRKKPGTIPPVDVTAYCNKTATANNRFELFYTEESMKRLQLQIHLVQTKSIEELIEQVKKGRVIAKDSVIQRFRASADDDDGIELGSFDLSLRDSFSGMRIQTPCRSFNCKHNQCFDLLSWLSFNQSTPQWVCPICEVDIGTINAVGVDKYFEEILTTVSSSIDHVTVDPLGNWRLPGADNAPPPQANPAAPLNGGIPEIKSSPPPNDRVLPQVYAIDDSDDEPEQPTAPAVTTAPAAINTPVSPPFVAPQIRDRPSTPIISSSRGSANAPITIDLTSDTDEEDEAERPNKRARIEPTAVELDSSSSDAAPANHTRYVAPPQQNLTPTPQQIDSAQPQPLQRQPSNTTHSHLPSIANTFDRDLPLGSRETSHALGPGALRGGEQIANGRPWYLEPRSKYATASGQDTVNREVQLAYANDRVATSENGGNSSTEATRSVWTLGRTLPPFPNGPRVHQRSPPTSAHRMPLPLHRTTSRDDADLVSGQAASWLGLHARSQGRADRAADDGGLVGAHRDKEHTPSAVDTRSLPERPRPELVSPEQAPSRTAGATLPKSEVRPRANFDTLDWEGHASINGDSPAPSSRVAPLSGQAHGLPSTNGLPNGNGNGNGSSNGANSMPSTLANDNDPWQSLNSDMFDDDDTLSSQWSIPGPE